MGQNLEHLQRSIQKYYRRNKGILDTMSKLQISVAKTERNIIRAATQCGCVEIFTKKQPPDFNGEAESMLKGSLCADCQEKTEQNMGDALFYLVCLAVLTGTSMENLLENQIRQLDWLGKFNLK